MTPTSKVCTKCAIDHPLANYTNKPRGKYGKNSICKCCLHLHYLANKTRVIAYSINRARTSRKARDKRNEWRRNDALRRRNELLEFLGKKCCRCGFDDPRALQIDHVNGGGKQDLERRKRITYTKRDLVVYENPQMYQLLCANCNWIKRHENGETNQHKKS